MAPPRRTGPRKKEPVVLAELTEEHLTAVHSANQLVNNANLQLSAAKLFLEKVNDEIQEAYDLPGRFRIDLKTGIITKE